MDDGQQAVNIDEFLRQEGFDTDEAVHEGRIVLERERLTRSGKQAFVASKLPRARAALRSTLVRTCAGCRRVAGDPPGRRPVAVSPGRCELCGGSNNRRAVERCVVVMRGRGIGRVVIVGGTPPQQRDVRDLFADTTVELRFVDGTRASHSQKDAEHNKRWADLVVIWGPTPVRHAVSELYTEQRYEGLKVVQVPRRGIEALCDEVVRALRPEARKS
ncbi:MAG: hypothetical protein IVW36_06795 [Dehalococcoidia bacterium]|nr:hypothetical protein [Dehalococcoidia bacterium]